MANTRRIGTIRLNCPTVFHYAGYETAAWWQNVECNPQTVELVHYVREDRIAFSFEGTVVADYFPSYSGVGKLDAYHFSYYGYNLFGLLHDIQFHVVLDEGVEVTAEAKVLGDRAKGSAFTAVFARIVPEAKESSDVSRGVVAV